MHYPSSQRPSRSTRGQGQDHNKTPRPIHETSMWVPKTMAEAAATDGQLVALGALPGMNIASSLNWPG